MTWPATLRRLQWRIGRRLYIEARGEPRSNSIETNGEKYVQSAVIAATADEPALVILDIGANQGDWTRPLLAALPDGRLVKGGLRLHLFEPVPETRARLIDALSNVRGGNLAVVEAYALSDRAGTSQMAVMSETGGTNTLALDDAIRHEAVRMIEVELQTLANFCQRHCIDHIHLVKCDAEGHDLRVMRGARPLLAAERIDVLQFEYNHRWVHSRAFLKDVFDLIKGLPYALGRIRSNSIEIFEAWHPEMERFFEANYLLVHRRAQRWFACHCGSFDGSNTYA